MEESCCPCLCFSSQVRGRLPTSHDHQQDRAGADGLSHLQRPPLREAAAPARAVGPGKVQPSEEEGCIEILNVQRALPRHCNPLLPPALTWLRLAVCGAADNSNVIRCVPHRGTAPGRGTAGVNAAAPHVRQGDQGAVVGGQHKAQECIYERYRDDVDEDQAQGGAG